MHVRVWRIPDGKHVLQVTFSLNVRLEQWYSDGTASVHRGSLLFSLPIHPDWKQLAHYAYESNDYQGC